MAPRLLQVQRIDDAAGDVQRELNVVDGTGFGCLERLESPATSGKEEHQILLVDGSLHCAKEAEEAEDC